MITVRQRKSLATLTVAALFGFVTGCGGGSEDSAAPGGTGSAERPSEVEINFVLDQTGVAQTFTGAVRQGWDLRIEQANQAKELEGTTLTTKFSDSKSDPAAGAAAITQVVSADAPFAVFGTASSVAPAVAPIAQRAGMPLVTIYSGTPNLVDVGENIFRVTAPQNTYHGIQSEYFAKQGVKRVAIIYNNDNATLKGLAEDFYPKAAKEDGYEIVKSSGVSFKATDLTAEMTGILASKPDAVLMLVLAQQNTSVVNQLRRASFSGVIAAQPGVGRQALEALKADANGIVYPLDFTADAKAPSAAAFSKAFQAKYDVAPDTFGASGYDGATMVIEALKVTKGLTRDAMRQALLDVSNKGFDAAAGPLRFEKRDARVPGVMVRWQDGKEVPL